jgi:hypothetical protein
MVSVSVGRVVWVAVGREVWVKVGLGVGDGLAVGLASSVCVGVFVAPKPKGVTVSDGLGVAVRVGAVEVTVKVWEG